MSVSPYLRSSDQPPRHASAPFEVIQTELEAMRLIAQALTTIPDERIRARVMAWVGSAVPSAASGAAPETMTIARLFSARTEPADAEPFLSEEKSEMTAPQETDAVQATVDSNGSGLSLTHAEPARQE